MPFPTLQFPLYSLADQIGSLLAVLKNIVHALQRPLRKSRRNLLVIDLFSAHAKIYQISTNLKSPSECDII
jgi:hypothetical protein